ncbi:nucleotide sugar dehydrogenase [Kushneria aurantia]|uniref:UDP-glucose 6-dehydrogenase n=1 Tax=Kushneria aurantia TaxID=504092 RepID=A0ABV6G4I3_9GAMM|nr:nucleotide sugar dehydrogenase [Kushneria aurantia]
MQVVVHGSELSAATAAAALSMVGHHVWWWPHPAQPWEKLVETDWIVNEPGLYHQLCNSIESGSLTLCDSARSLPSASVYWLAVSSDQRQDADRWVEQTLGKEPHDFVLVNNSTFPIGHTEELEQLLRREHQVAVALPEVLEEGRALTTFTRPDSWILGSENDWATRHIAELLRAFNRRENNLRLMPRRAAELTKLAVIGMLATRVSYMNELAGLADSLDVDIDLVRQAMGADRRIGRDYLYPGSGFGGPSFARNLYRLSSVRAREGQRDGLLERVIDINTQQQEVLFRKLWQHFHGNLGGRRVAIWGAAFKPGTPRIAHAPILRLLDALWAQGVHVHLHDPAALPAIARYYGDHPLLTLAESPEKACDEVDALLLVTEWKEYWNPDWRRLSTLMKTPLLLDGRNIYDPSYVAEQGFTYRGVGRRSEPMPGTLGDNDF